jgi:hypothetical protein
LFHPFTLQYICVCAYIRKDQKLVQKGGALKEQKAVPLLNRDRPERATLLASSSSSSSSLIPKDKVCDMSLKLNEDDCVSDLSSIVKDLKKVRRGRERERFTYFSNQKLNVLVCTYLLSVRFFFFPFTLLLSLSLSRCIVLVIILLLSAFFLQRSAEFAASTKPDTKNLTISFEKFPSRNGNEETCLVYNKLKFFPQSNVSIHSLLSGEV